jgi:hypothetical protein
VTTFKPAARCDDCGATSVPERGASGPQVLRHRPGCPDAAPRFVVASTGRGVSPTSRWARQYSATSLNYADKPLLHASPFPPVKATRTGTTMVAACGARVSIVYDGRPFDRDPGRKCRRCIDAVRGGA